MQQAVLPPMSPTISWNILRSGFQYGGMVFMNVKRLLTPT